ncbi:MAG: peptidoglycan editing factor PgeF [Burkholderiales bacterium]|nr:peptidoglycan editing factor PgeF [Burkholderiales bacterium]
MQPDWLIPDWPALANVRAVCTTRAGGESMPPYDSLNLGDHVGDSPQAVERNREVMRRAVAARPVFLEQVHGSRVVTLDTETADGTQADGCVTTQRGVACTIMVADCLPVLLADMQGRVVAAAHAGWRGLAGVGGQGILESVSEAIRAAARAQHAQGAIELVAWLGPCIGPEAFEVGPEVKAAFELHDPQAAPLFRPHGAGKWLADLQGLARRRLAALGITAVHGNHGGAAWCTVSNPSRFFSHRRDRVSGRLAACVWLG